MKITIEQYEEKFSYESELDSMNMSELTEKLYGLCIAAGYHPNSVGECFYTKGQEMTEHLYPDDTVLYPDDKVLYPDDNVEEDVVSSGVSDLIQVRKTISILSRYREERKFNIITKNCVEYSFEDDGHVGVQRNDDGSLESVDPSGGPYIGVGNNLGYIHEDLDGLIVTKIKHNDMPGNLGSYYLTVE